MTRLGVGVGAAMRKRRGVAWTPANDPTYGSSLVGLWTFVDGVTLIDGRVSAWAPLFGGSSAGSFVQSTVALRPLRTSAGIVFDGGSSAGTPVGLEHDSKAIFGTLHKRGTSGTLLLSWAPTSITDVSTYVFDCATLGSSGGVGVQIHAYGGDDLYVKSRRGDATYAANFAHTDQVASGVIKHHWIKRHYTTLVDSSFTSKIGANTQVGAYTADPGILEPSRGRLGGDATYSAGRRMTVRYFGVWSIKVSDDYAAMVEAYLLARCGL